MGKRKRRVRGRVSWCGRMRLFHCCKAHARQQIGKVLDGSQGRARREHGLAMKLDVLNLLFDVSAVLLGAKDTRTRIGPDDRREVAHVVDVRVPKEVNT